MSALEGFGTGDHAATRAAAVLVASQALGSSSSNTFLNAQRKVAEIIELAGWIVAGDTDDAAPDGLRLSRETLEEWAERELSSDDVARLREAIFHSSIPNSINLIVGSFK